MPALPTGARRLIRVRGAGRAVPQRCPGPLPQGRRGDAGECKAPAPTFPTGPRAVIAFARAAI